MRKRNLLLFVLMLVLTGSVLFAQDHTKIEGSGNVISREVVVQSFDELALSGAFCVQLEQGSKEGVRIDAEDNLQNLFEVKQEGKKLMVGFKKNMQIKTKKKMMVYVTVRSLKLLQLKMVGEVTSKGELKAGDLKIENKSVGEVNLNIVAISVELDNKSVGELTLRGTAEKSVIRNKSVGELDASRFVVQQMEIDNSGIGSTEVNAVKELKVKDSSLSRVTNKGAAVARNMKPVRI